MELNAYLCRNANAMAKFYQILGNSEKADQYTKIGNDFQVTLLSLVVQEMVAPSCLVTALPLPLSISS